MAIVAVAMSMLAPRAAVAAEPPTVTIDPSPVVANTTAEVSGTVDTHGEAATIYAEFSTSEEGEFTFQEIGLIAAGETGPIPVSGRLVDLKPNTHYFFRLDAEVSGIGETYSPKPYPSATTEAIAPPTVSIDPVANVTSESATFSSHIAPNAPGPAPQDPGFTTSWEFLCTPECPGLNGQIAGDDNDHLVSVTAEGLRANTSYQVHLIAINAGGPSETATETFHTTKKAPAIGAEAVLSVGTGDAEVSASIDPENDSTTYWVEYGPTTDYGTSTPVTGPIHIEPGGAPSTVSSHISGLVAASTYHWRMAARNSTGTTHGSDKTFTTFASSGKAESGCPNQALRYGAGSLLPDCRAYEQATPVDKNGANPIVEAKYSQAAIDGGGITFYTLSGIPGDAGAQDYPIHVSRRVDGQWLTSGLQPPVAYGAQARILGWSDSLDLAVSSARSLQGGQALFGLQTETGGVQTILPRLATSQRGEIFLAAISHDGRYIVFETAMGLLPGSATEHNNVYLVDRVTGALSLVGVMNDGDAPAEGAFPGAYGWFNGSRQSGGSSAFFYTNNVGVLSETADAVYFTAAGSGTLYVRTNPQEPQSNMSGDDCTEPQKACTVSLGTSHKTNGSGPGGTDPFGPQPTAFMTATPDGSRAFFTSQEELTNNASTGAADEGNDLYLFDLRTKQLRDLTPDQLDPAGAEVRGVLGASSDGKYVYFAANGVLAPGATPGNCQVNFTGAPGDQCNLYVWHEASGGSTIKFVSRLENGGGSRSSDANNWRPNENNGESEPGRTARVTPDGSVMLFRSVLPLTGYSANGLPEYFRYDARTGALTCVTCNPTGAVPSAPPLLQGTLGRPGPLAPEVFLARNLSNDGSRVFFETSDPLVADDTNGVEDVYEWEAAGVGSCRSANLATGCLALISDGTNPGGSHFVDASKSGDDVFILTSSRLVTQDRDQIADIYDVRVDGGLLAQSELPPISCSSEGACRSSSASPEQSPAVGTSSFTGPGNPVPKKHHKKKHHKHHKRKHHKHHKKKHHKKKARSVHADGAGRAGR
jgi:hypothetical protein